MARSDAERLADIRATYSRAVRGFAPPEDLTVSEWADRYRRLSPESSAEAGPWRTSRTPYLREPMDAFTDPSVRRIVIVAGSQIGSWLLSRLPEVFLRWFYAAFLVFVIVSQVVFTPLRDSAIHLHVVTGILLVALGVVIGVLSGLLGIGGGAVAVPSLSLLFGASDLIARGTSLLAMFPSAIAGTAANWRRGLVYLKHGLIIGVCAAVTAPLGTMLAGMITPRMGANLFVAYLAVLFVRSVWSALKVTPGVNIPKLHDR